MPRRCRGVSRIDSLSPMGADDTDERDSRSVQPPWPVIERVAAVAAVHRAIDSRPPQLQLLEGDAGTGKSALAATIADLSKRETVTLVALAERKATPLGVFDDVLRELGAVDLESASAAVVETLGRSAERTLVVLDDAPRLDPASAEVVARLVRGFGIPIVATARTGEPLPEPLQRLGDDDLVRRHRLGGLSTAEVGRLLEARFRVPAREEDVHRLVAETAGNPLHVRVIVEAAIEAGQVLHRGHAVQIARPDPPAHLRSALAARVADLTADARRLLVVIALAQPVGRAEVLVPPGRSAALAELAQHGMIAAESVTGRLRIAHPLIVEALPASAREPAAIDEAVRLLRGGGEPPRRFAAVGLERQAGRRVAHSELVWAAGYASASADHRAAAELAVSAAEQPAARGPAFTAELAAATYLSRAGEVDDAERRFTHAETLVSTAAERAALARAVGEHLAFRRHDPRAAVAQGELARDGLTAQGSVALDADIWRWRVLAGDESGTDDPREPEIRRAIAAAVTASMRGEPGAALTAARPLLVPATDLGRLASTAAMPLGLQRIVALRSAGRGDEAAAYLESARAAAGEEAGFYSVMLAAQRAQEGRLADARHDAELAVEQLRRWDGGELLALALAVRATITAQSGAHAEAREQLAELDGVTVSGAAVLQRAECEAFLLFADGDTAGAVDTVLAVVIDAIASDYRYLGALTLATALRFGEVPRTAILAEQLSAGMAENSEPCFAVRDMAVALRDGDSESVAPAARRLAGAGLVTAAIDALALAIALPSSEETRRELHAVASTLATGVDAPPLQRREQPALTARELQVAQAAADRLRSREIAELMGVSARTVENQLYSVYRKLGIASRDELRQALLDVGLLSPPSSV